LERPASGRIAVSDIAKKILRPQNEQEELVGLREAVLKAPEISGVYSHYRGENLPDTQFFQNALVDKFGIPKEKVGEFKTILFDTLNKAKLIEQHNGKQRLIDVSGDLPTTTGASETLKKLGKSITLDANDSCFMVMPFAAPLGNYYEKVYKPAIEKAGLKAVRADTEIFGAGKIMDQVWSGINAAKVLVAELTTRNPNVFYELGLAHALKKPVVLVSSNEDDVPFDLKHTTATFPLTRRRPRMIRSIRSFKRGDHLAAFPHLGRMVNSYKRPGIRELVEAPYRILRRVRRQRVEVVAAERQTR